VNLLADTNSESCFTIFAVVGSAVVGSSCEKSPAPRLRLEIPLERPPSGPKLRLGTYPLPLLNWINFYSLSILEGLTLTKLDGLDSFKFDGLC